MSARGCTLRWSFEDRLVAARKRAGFRTQADLGNEIGASRNTVAQWERGETLPEGRLMIQLPEALGVSADWLFYGIEPDAASNGFRRIAAIVDEVRSTANGLDALSVAGDADNGGDDEDEEPGP